MATRMLQRRGTAAEWAAENPILADGEMGFETDTKIIKMGDGITTWAELGLPYLTTGGGTMTGPLTLIAPTAAAHAARKTDVETAVAAVANAAITTQTGRAYQGSARASTGTLDTFEQVFPEYVAFPDLDRPVQILATGSVTQAADAGTTSLRGKSRLEISLDGGATWDLGGQTEGDTNRDGAGINLVSHSPVHVYGATPTGEIRVRMKVYQQSGTLGTQFWRQGTIIALALYQ